jgi:outer membrane murein-binding lipoprotein Lpp
MLKRVAVVLTGFVLVGSSGIALAGDNWMEGAVIKLIEKYYELSQKVQELSQRIERLERKMEVEKIEREITERELKEEGIKEKYQTQKRLKVRKCPRTNCKVVVILEKDEVVFLLSRKDEWAFIETTDGVRGWVPSKYLREYSY